ncbi:tRNA pseudouridine(55) synthase TruB [Candidatus Peregrinibacteria bacterium]|nr:MAG: tRNA pseudouridine(55) synthase TruB [Candidatus Peregrinibacteria bacterium]
MDGLLIIDKPLNWTSFDVVAKVRNAFSKLDPIRKRVKVGHTGTLDPLATGVLVLCVGSATKKVSELTAVDKEYIAEVTLGATSTTDDAEGEIKTIEGEDNYPRLLEEDIKKILPQFTGTFDQIPPQFSAKKVDGKRAYESARAGKTVELKPMNVTVHELELLSYEWPVMRLRIHCGKGFYVRSLARDLGVALGVGGYLTALQRTRVGRFTLDQAIDINHVDPSQLIPTSLDHKSMKAQEH